MKTVLLLSGGPDSTTLAYFLKNRGNEVHALTFKFGELEGDANIRCAKKVAKQLNIRHKVVDIESALRKLLDISTGPITTLRNPDIRPFEFGSSIVLNLAAAYAKSINADSVNYAIHKDDTVFNENNREYFDSLTKAATIYSRSPFSFDTPFIDLSKDQVLQIGIDLGVDYDATWSCTQNSDEHCKKCKGCSYRRDAFAKIGKVDTVTS